MTKKLEPLLNRVILKQIKMKNVGNLIVSAGSNRTADKAEVLAVGPGCYDIMTGKYITMGLKAGEIVMINSMMGMRATLDNGDEVIIQKEDEIVAKVVEADEAGQ